jgi:hypothetical protein
MATRTIAPMKIVSPFGHYLAKFPLAATQSFKKGELVYKIAATGQITVVAANGQCIFGMAAEDATSGSAGAVDVLVDVILPGCILEGNVYHDTAASAVMTDINVATGLAEVATSSNKTVVDITATSNPAFRIIERIKEDSATDVYPRVRLSVISTYLQSDIATIS